MAASFGTNAGSPYYSFKLKKNIYKRVINVQITKAYSSYFAVTLWNNVASTSVQRCFLLGTWKSSVWLKTSQQSHNVETMSIQRWFNACVESTSNRRWFNVMWLLGCFLLTSILRNYKYNCLLIIIGLEDQLLCLQQNIFLMISPYQVCSFADLLYVQTM